jgi:F0F1-type ATP synthase membrane subunit b/b'
MSNLKDQLIKLGNRNPNLRDHIRPVLQHIVRGKQARRKRARTEWINTSGPRTSEFSALPEDMVEEAIREADRGVQDALSRFPTTPRQFKDAKSEIQDSISTALRDLYDEVIDAFDDRNPQADVMGEQYDILEFQMLQSVYEKLRRKYREEVDVLRENGEDRVAREMEDILHDHLHELKASNAAMQEFS